MKTARILLSALFILSIFSFNALAKDVKKIGVVDAAKVFDKYHKTTEADKKLEKISKAKKAEADKLVKEINKLKDEIQLLSKDARDVKEKAFNDKKRALQDFDRETRLELNRERDDILKDILEEVSETIADYGKKQGYDLVLDNRVILYSDESLDISENVIKVLNKK